MTLDEILKEYDFNETEDECSARVKSGKLHPVYKKWLDATWIIQSIWGFVDKEELSLSKARELTACVIEKHLNKWKEKN